MALGPQHGCRYAQLEGLRSRPADCRRINPLAKLVPDDRERCITKIGRHLPVLNAEDIANERSGDDWECRGSWRDRDQ